MLPYIYRYIQYVCNGFWGPFHIFKSALKITSLKNQSTRTTHSTHDTDSIPATNMSYNHQHITKLINKNTCYPHARHIELYSAYEDQQNQTAQTHLPKLPVFRQPRHVLERLWFMLVLRLLL